MIGQVCNATTAKKIITMEPAGINSELIKRLHNISPEKIIFKDQPDVAASVSNTNKRISVNFQKSALLLTALPGRELPAVNTLVDSLQQYGMKLVAGLTGAFFLKMLKDSTLTQLNLVVRGNKYGLVFADTFLSYRSLKYQLQNAYGYPRKEYIYIISNVADTLETIMAGSPLFSRVITSAFTASNRESFETACSHMKLLYAKAYHEQLTIPLADWKKMEETGVDLAAALGGLTKKTRNQVLVKTGKLSENDIRNIPAILWDYFNDKFGREGTPYKPKNLDNLFRDVQTEKLLELKASPAKLRPEYFLRSIPVLKAANKSRTCTSTC